MRLGGRDPRTAARAVRSRTRRCPARSRKAMVGSEASYHRPPDFLFRSSSFFCSCFRRSSSFQRSSSLLSPPPPKTRDQNPPFLGAAGSSPGAAVVVAGAGSAAWPLPVRFGGGAAVGSPLAPTGSGGGPESLPNTPAIASMNERDSCSGQTVVGCVPLTKYSV